jgi:hypothetical protein
MTFGDQVQQAHGLGRRMALAGFSEEDNPYTNLNYRLKKAWSEAFSTAQLSLNLERLASTRLRTKIASLTLVRKDG